MKAESLMIGDWVRDAANEEYVQYNLRDFVTAPTRLLANCEPVLLNTPILEKNPEAFAMLGFTFHTNGFERNGFCLLCGESHICGILYAHELQHALRLCGLAVLADNFKV